VVGGVWLYISKLCSSVFVFAFYPLFLFLLSFFFSSFSSFLPFFLFVYLFKDIKYNSRGHTTISFLRVKIIPLVVLAKSSSCKERKKKRKKEKKVTQRKEKKENK